VCFGGSPFRWLPAAVETFKKAAPLDTTMAIEPPTERECERCGRQDEWDDDEGTWVIVESDGEKVAGSPYCLHEWDITGTYNPLASTE
jgi:hypothetical protein